MFNIGAGEVIVILFVALIFLGPERLPTAARQVGKTIATLRGMAQGFQKEFEDAINIAEHSARESDARAKGADLVAASKGALDEASDTGSDAANAVSASDEHTTANDRPLASNRGFDPTAAPDRTEKPVSADGPVFHSAGPNVGPKITPRTQASEAAAAETANAEIDDGDNTKADSAEPIA